MPCWPAMCCCRTLSLHPRPCPSPWRSWQAQDAVWMNCHLSGCPCAYCGPFVYEMYAMWPMHELSAVAFIGALRTYCGPCMCLAQRNVIVSLGSEYYFLVHKECHQSAQTNTFLVVLLITSSPPGCCSAGRHFHSNQPVRGCGAPGPHRGRVRAGGGVSRPALRRSILLRAQAQQRGRPCRCRPVG